MCVGSITVGGWQTGDWELYLVNGILLPHDMHAFASVHILLQHPHLAGTSPLHHHSAFEGVSLACYNQQVGRWAPAYCAHASVLCKGALVAQGTLPRTGDLSVQAAWLLPALQCKCEPSWKQLVMSSKPSLCGA